MVWFRGRFGDGWFEIQIWIVQSLGRGYVCCMYDLIFFFEVESLRVYFQVKKYVFSCVKIFSFIRWFRVKLGSSLCWSVFFCFFGGLFRFLKGLFGIQQVLIVRGIGFGVFSRLLGVLLLGFVISNGSSIGRGKNTGLRIKEIRVLFLRFG